MIALRARHLNWSRTLCLLLACLGITFAPALQAGDDILTNGSIIELQKLNLGDSVIIDKIKSSKCNFDTSVSGLTALKAANISSPVIAAMIVAPPTAGATAPAGDPNDPATPHAPGIWVLVGSDGQNKLIPLAAERPTEISRGGFIGPWGIGKVATTARLAGIVSQTELSRRRPQFYLYMKTMGMELAGAVTPEEITLARFTVLGKDDKHNPNQRALDVAIHGAYGSSYGVDRKAVKAFETTPVADGIYKLVPKEDLADGEYALCAGANSAAMTGHYQYFTFGIKSK